MKTIMCVLVGFAMAACMSEAQEPADEETVALAPEDTEQSVSPGDEELSAELLADCVYVQWCNASGATGTVCKVRSSCRSQCNSAGWETLRQECERDANAVCGGVTPEASLTCN